MRYGNCATLFVAACMLMIDPLSLHDAESVERSYPAVRPNQSVHAITRDEARAILFADRVQWASLGPITSDPVDAEPEVTGSIAMRDTPAEPANATAADPGHIPQEEVCAALVSAALEHELPIGFLIRLIWQESRFSTWALSPVGAQGMAQFMPATASAMGLGDPFNPLEALPFSAKLLRELRQQFGNLGLAAAAYNAGPGRVSDWLKKRRKLPEETRNYVTIITGHAPERWKDPEADNPLASKITSRVPCARFDDTPDYVPPPREKPLLVEHKEPKAKKALLARAQETKRKSGSKADDKVAARAKRGGKAELAARIKSGKGRKALVIAVKEAPAKKGKGKDAGAPLQIAKVKGGKQVARAKQPEKTKSAAAKSKAPAKTRLARAG